MKSPAFSFYVRDWLCSKTVSKMHSESISKQCSRMVGAYVYLLCEAWLEIPQATLPDDDFELARMAKVTPDEWQTIKPTIMLAFQKDSSGRLYNDRQMREANKQQARSKSGSKGGSQKLANRVATLENEIEDEKGTLSLQVEKIYLSYPRKVGKPKALSAIKSALKKIDANKLLELTVLYAKCRANCDHQFTPHPSTWFSQERYNDDPSTWRDSAQQKQNQVIHRANGMKNL